MQFNKTLNHLILLLFFGFSSLSTVSCSNFLKSDGGSSWPRFYDSAMNDHNKVPNFLRPPEIYSKDFVASDPKFLDPVLLQARADYYYSLGEAQSLDGQSQRAIESFKQVLIYDTNSVSALLRISVEHLKLGMITESLEYAETAMKKKPDYVDAKLLVAGLYVSLKDYSKGIQQYEEILKIEPQNAEATLYLGAIYAEKKESEKAIALFKNLLKHEEYNSPHMAYYYMGRVRSEQKEAKYRIQAENYFLKALEVKPDHVDSVLALGLLYRNDNHFDKEIQIYKKFQSEQGPHPKIAQMLAEDYLEKEQYDEAYEQYEVLEKNNEDSLNIKVKMALILIEKKKYNTAISKLKEILIEVPESDKIRFYLAALYEEMNLEDQAIEEFSKIPEISQYYTESVSYQIHLYLKNKKHDEAFKVAKKAYTQRKDIPQFFAIYASLLDEKGNYIEAEQVLNLGIEKFPKNVQLHFYKATLYDRQGNKQQLIAGLKKVLEMDPKYTQALNYLAFTYAELGQNLLDAEALILKALAQTPSDGYVLDTYGWILFKQGKTDHSIKILESAIEKQPKEAIIAEHLGDAYYKKQLTNKALEMYQKAANMESDNKKQVLLKMKIDSLEKQHYSSEESKSLGTRNPASRQDIESDDSTQ